MPDDVVTLEDVAAYTATVAPDAHIAGRYVDNSACLIGMTLRWKYPTLRTRALGGVVTVGGRIQDLSDDVQVLESAYDGFDQQQYDETYPAAGTVERSDNPWGLPLATLTKARWLAYLRTQRSGSQAVMRYLALVAQKEGERDG